MRWYLIHTKRCGETLAQSNLERQRYVVYSPRVVQPVRRRGRWKDQVVALFPRYLFLRLDEGRQSLAPVRSTLGVASIVRFGSDYAIVPDRVIRDLQAREDPESGLYRLSHWPLFSPGAAVTVAAGPFSGLQGIFQRRAGAERVVVLLDLLGQAASVRVSADLVLPSNAAWQGLSYVCE